MATQSPRPTMDVPGVSSRRLVPAGGNAPHQGTLRYLHGGHGDPVVLLHTVRTQAEHFHRLIPLLLPHRTVFALDLPGMGHSEIVPGGSYQEPDLRAGVTRLLVDLDLTRVTLLGESIGAVLALTAAVDHPDRISRVVAVNPYDYGDGILRSSLLARGVIGGILTPALGPVLARLENRVLLRTILRGGLVDTSALGADYLDELASVGRRRGYPTVARAVYQNLPSMIAARSRYPDVRAPVHLVYGAQDWSRPSDRRANRDLLPDAEHVEVPRAGHFLALERPRLLADLLTGTRSVSPDLS